MHVVDVDWPSSIETAHLQELLTHTGTNIRTIYLHDFLEDGADAVMQLIAKLCGNLEQLSLVRTSVTDAFIEALNLCPKLTKIRFERNSSLDTSKLLGVTCPRVQLVSLLESATDANAFAVSAAFPNALKVGVSNSPHFTEVGLNHIAAHCKNLQEACLYECPITCASVVNLAHQCHDLRVIDIGGTRAGDNAVHALATHCRHLTDLYVDHNGEITDQALLALAQYAAGTLRTLYIAGCVQISAAGVAVLLDSAKALRTLSIGEGTSYSKRELLNLTTKCGALTLMRLRAIKLADSVLTSLSQHAREIQKLDLTGCDGFSEEGLAAIALRLTKLQSLVFVDVNNRVGLSHLSRTLWRQLRPGLVISGDENLPQYSLIL